MAEKSDTNLGTFSLLEEFALWSFIHWRMDQLALARQMVAGLTKTTMLITTISTRLNKHMFS